MTDWKPLPKRALVLAAAALAALGAVVATWSTPASAAGTSDWTQYQADPGGSGLNRAETTVNASTASSLHSAWVAHGGRASSAQPLVVGDTVYWGSWDGVLHATSASTGASLWTRSLGVTTCSGCNPGTAGMTSTPAYGSIGSTPVLFAFDGGTDSVGAGQVAAFAVNANTGAIIWRTNIVAVGKDTFAWSSVRLYNGSVYVSTSSMADHPVIPAHVYKLDATTGAMQANVSTGGGVFGTLTVDTATGDIYVPVGSPTGGGTNDFSTSLLEVRASDLSVVAHWMVPKSQQLSDGDFGSVPTLFTATIGGVTRQLVGLGNKNGIFYAWDRTNVAAGPVWERNVAKGSNDPQGGGGTLSPAVWDGGTLYVAGGNTTIGGKTCAGGVRALNPATGTSKWEFCATTGHVLGALAAAPGVIIVPAGPSVLVLDAGTGKQIFAYRNPSGALYWGAPSVGDGHVFAPGMDGTLTALAPSTSTGGSVMLSNLSVKDTANAAHWSPQTNLQLGVTLYGDRAYTLTAAPSQVLGAAWIQAAGNSKTFTGNPLVTFTINQQATVYVGLDKRAARLSWLDSSWTDTGATASATTGINYEVYSKTFPAGTVALGPQGAASSSAAVTQYTIAVK